MKKIWIGRRETDILTYKPSFFNFSITYYGSNKKHNFSFAKQKRTCVKYDLFFYEYVLNCITNIEKENGECELYFYNNRIAEKLQALEPSIIDKCKNCNSFKITKWLNNKSYVRVWLSNIVPVPPFTIFSKSECNFKALNQHFPSYNEFIIQKNYSSGGSGTYLLTKDNQNKVLELLHPNYPYLVSPFLKNTFSACCHVIIMDDDFLLFPIGLQILTDEMDYRGTTYVLPDEIKKRQPQIKKFIEDITRKISNIGYRGICGYDFLVNEKEIYLIEINPRFMGSSYLINMGLFENNLPSLFVLNDAAFQNDLSVKKYKQAIEKMIIPYTSFSVYFDNTNKKKMLFNKEKIFTDGYNKNMKCEVGSYLYSYVTKDIIF